MAEDTGPSRSSAEVATPPSPTLSRPSSVHLQSSISLRDNKPTQDSAVTSLNLLRSNDQRRKTSNATAISAASTVADQAPSSSYELGTTRTNTTTVSFKNPDPDPPPLSNEQDNKKEAKTQAGEAIQTPRVFPDDGLDPTPFHFKPYHLAHLLDPKNMEELTNMGGINGILQGLGSHPERGLSQKSINNIPHGAGEDGPAFAATLDDRKRVYGDNVLPRRPVRSLLSLMWLALKDKVLILLSISAVVSLSLGLFLDFGSTHKKTKPAVDWVEGVAILVAIFIVVTIGSLNDWQKERQSRYHNQLEDERGVKVIRDGTETVIDVRKLVVGDIALLEPGEIVPCDGIFLCGHNVKCDESGATGESDLIRKVTYDEMLALSMDDCKDISTLHTDCFLLSGAKVVEGQGRYIVVAVGPHSFNGRVMMGLRSYIEATPLQIKVNTLAECIARLGTLIGMLLFLALLIRFFIQLGKGEPHRDAVEKGIVFINIVIIVVTLVVVAVPEGLPLNVSLAHTIAAKRMKMDGLLVRLFGSCERMANVSVICTDKTGILTQNVTAVVAGSLGVNAKFVHSLAGNPEFANAGDHNQDFYIDQAELSSVLSPQLCELFNDAISINSTAFQDNDEETGELVFVGSKIECALLRFAKDYKWGDHKSTRDTANIVQIIPFSSEHRSMGIVVRLSSGRYRLYVTGASEVLSRMCTRHIVVDKEGVYSDVDVETKEMDQVAQDNVSQTIAFYANKMLRTVALCYREFNSWPPPGIELDENNEAPYQSLKEDLTLIGIFAIEDPLRCGILDAITQCNRSGVAVKMCTSDNVHTARAIATQCGIHTPGGIIMEGSIFRILDPLERVTIIPRLQVLAGASSEDKQILVETLKALGETVAVTGNSANDAPALKTADIGFSMGIAGTEVAKEASDIILMRDDFTSIVKAIMWGRCVNDGVRKLLQFQVSTIITAVVVTFVSAIASEQEDSVLSPVQLLWIAIITDTLAALAFVTDIPNNKLLDRKPDRGTQKLFSIEMYKMILMQSIYQITILLILHFFGPSFLFRNSDNHQRDLQSVNTIVFNAFVFLQIFNSINCRRLDNRLNVFEGILKNLYFLITAFVEMAVQVVIVFVGGAAFRVHRLQAREWGISLAVGISCILLGVIVRCIPNKPFERIFEAVGLLDPPYLLPTSTPEVGNEWNPAIELVRSDLNMFSSVRGGRMRSRSSLPIPVPLVNSHSRRTGALPVIIKGRVKKEKTSPPVTILTMAPSLMAGATAASRTYSGPQMYSIAWFFTVQHAFDSPFMTSNCDPKSEHDSSGGM